MAECAVDLEEVGFATARGRFRFTVTGAEGCGLSVFFVAEAVLLGWRRDGCVWEDGDDT